MTDRNANRPGYKKTRVGWIPEEWDIAHLEEISEINKENLSTSTPDDYSFTYINLGDVDSGFISISSAQITFSAAPSRARRVVHKGDILLSTVRPYLKGFAFIDFLPKDVICSTGFAVITPKKDINAKFLYQYIFSEKAARYFNACVVGSNYPALNNSDVEKMSIPLPQPSEQKKIAEILSTWGRAIEQTQKLIDAKQRLKQGLMQQLLTGRMRFPGFGPPVEKAGELPEGWERYEFSDLASISSEKYTPQENSNLNHCIELEHIEQDTGRIIGWTDTNHQLSTKNIFHPNNILFGKLRPYLRKFAFVNFHGVCSSEIWVFNSKSTILPYYLYLLIQTDRFMSAATQTTGTKMPRADLGVISRRVFYIPQLDEQRTISKILINIDKQIEYLENANSLFQGQKKGLRTRLITGVHRI